MNERIKKIMEVKNLSATQFSDEINIQRSSLSHVLSGRNKPSLDFMIKIKSRFPEINLDWLLIGNGKMINEIVPEKETKENDDSQAIVENLPEIGLFSESETESLQTDDRSETIAKSEEPPIYPQKKPDLGKSAEKVIILYNDNTFSVYTQKG